jgi:hypothetical protein
MCQEHRDQERHGQEHHDQEHHDEVKGSTKKSSHIVGNFIGRSMIMMVRFYQRGISPLLGKNCRYEPTCSEYFVLAVQKYGPLRGAWKGFWRIMRCHPFRPGGFDPP